MKNMFSCCGIKCQLPQLKDKNGWWDTKKSYICFMWAMEMCPLDPLWEWEFFFNELAFGSKFLANFFSIIELFRGQQCWSFQLNKKTSVFNQLNFGSWSFATRRGSTRVWTNLQEITSSSPKPQTIWGDNRKFPSLP